MKTPPIKIAGLGCSWNEHYARLYKEKLCEVGFEAKILEIGGRHLVAYSYRAFTFEETKMLITDILGEANDELDEWK